MMRFKPIKKFPIYQHPLLIWYFGLWQDRVDYLLINRQSINQSHVYNDVSLSIANQMEEESYR